MDVSSASVEKSQIDGDGLQYGHSSYIPALPPDYITAVNMEDYGPPKYDEPIIEGMVSLELQDVQAAQMSGLPTLAYVDFLPYCFRRGDKKTKQRPVFDTFRGVFSYANSWLANNRVYKVIDVESIERRVDFDGQVDSCETIEHTPTRGSFGILRGVRLWLIPNPDPSAPPQVIDYFNWLPEEDPLEHKFPIIGSLRFPNFKRMSVTLTKLNESISENLIPGTVLTVQTLEMIYQEQWRRKCLDPDLSIYFSSREKTKLHLSYLRIFYVVGPPKLQRIGLMDFTPVVTRKFESIRTLPLFEEYNDVFQKASNWIHWNDAKAVKFTNLQSLPFQTYQMDLIHCSVGDVIVDSDIPWHMTQGYSHFVKVLRVAYVELENPEDRLQSMMTSRLFIPVRTASKKAETLPQTLHRINAWLNLTGAHLRSVGTEKFLFSPQNVQNPVQPDRMSMEDFGDRGLYTITGIRLYLFGYYQEPDPRHLPPEVPYAIATSESASFCCII